MRPINLRHLPRGLEAASRRGTTFLFICVVLMSAAAAANPNADDHLFAGAQHFRSGRFHQALVEFRVAERLGGEGEATWYAAATLARLGRAEEAVASFTLAAEVAPDSGGPLFDYYRAVAAYEAKLYLTARTLLRQLIERSGPRIADEARKLEEQTATLFTSAPPRDAVDWYVARGLEAHQRGNPLLARAFLEEARALSALRNDGYRSTEVQAALSQLRR